MPWQSRGLNSHTLTAEGPGLVPNRELRSSKLQVMPSKNKTKSFQYLLRNNKFPYRKSILIALVL